MLKRYAALGTTRIVREGGRLQVSYRGNPHDMYAILGLPVVRFYSTEN